jgi:hypothetical protein
MVCTLLAENSQFKKTSARLPAGLCKYAAPARPATSRASAPASQPSFRKAGGDLKEGDFISDI